MNSKNRSAAAAAIRGEPADPAESWARGLGDWLGRLPGNEARLRLPVLPAAPERTCGACWTLGFATHVRSVHSVYVGVQRHSPAEACTQAARVAAARIAEWLRGAEPGATEGFEVVAGHDMPGACIQVAHWQDAGSAEHALAGLDLADLHAGLGDWRHSIGLWVEAFSAETGRIETLHVGPDPLRRRHGLARLPGTLAVSTDVAEVEPGRADLVPVSADPFALEIDPLLPPVLPFGYGEHVAGRNEQALVHVRGGYDWADCGPAEASLGERGLRVLVDLGLDDLWSHPVETGSYGLRKLARPGAEGAPLAGHGYAGFMRHAADAERWSAEQAAQLADFQRLLDQEGLPAVARQLRSYQEITRLAPGQARFGYVNCGPRTAVMRFLPMARRRLPSRPDLR